jgi:hypothetical protein
MLPFVTSCSERCGISQVAGVCSLSRARSQPNRSRDRCAMNSIESAGLQHAGSTRCDGSHRYSLPGSGWPALMLWSHKIIRWFTPVWLLCVLAGSVIGLATTPSSVTEALLVLETGTVLAALIGYLLERSGRAIRPFSNVYWFASMNIAFLLGIGRFFVGREQTFWTQGKKRAMSQSLVGKEALTR